MKDALQRSASGQHSPDFAELASLLHADAEHGECSRRARQAWHSEAQVDGLHDGQPQQDAFALHGWHTGLEQMQGTACTSRDHEGDGPTKGVQSGAMGNHAQRRQKPCKLAG